MAVQETKKECVHVKTQEEWDYVRLKKEYNLPILKPFESVCINLHFATWSDTSFYEKRDYTILTFEEFKQRYEHTEAFNPQPHYDNSKGSLYKVAEDRKWNSYQFDIIKRIDRAMKKGKFEEDLQKTKDLIDLWLLESKQNGL